MLNVEGIVDVQYTKEYQFFLHKQMLGQYDMTNVGLLVIKLVM